MHTVRPHFLFDHILIFSTVALMVGICVAHYQCSFLTMIVGALLLTMVTTLYQFYPCNKVLATLIIMSIYIIAISRYTEQNNYFQQFYTSINNPISCQATVESLEAIEHPRFNYLLVIKTYRIKNDNELWLEGFYTIHIYTRNKPHLMTGDLIELTNLKIKKPTNNEFEHYLIKEKISASCFIPVCEPTLLHRPVISIKRMINRFKIMISSSLEKKCSKITWALLSTIFLGKKSKIIRSTIKQNCKQWGISHYLARSGLHLILFIALWYLALSCFTLPYYCKSLCIITLTLLYYLLSWPSISFNRAFFTFILHHVCTIFSLPAQLFYLLTLVCFITLAINPYHLFALDFQLSFSLAFVISWQKHQLSIQSRSKQKLLNY